MKKPLAIAATLLLIVASIYFGSPYYAIYSLRKAAIAADKDKLEASVDFPAVRESLKSQMSLALTTKLQNDPEMKSNPFAGLGALLMPEVVDRIVDTYVTADGIAAMMRGQKPNEKAKVEASSDIESETEYVGLDRFRVRLHNTKLNEDGPSLLLERRGFASWKLIKLELPADLLDAR